MTSSMHRRLTRLAQRHEHLAGRMIVVAVQAERACDDALLDATLANAGVTRTDQDLVVKIKRFAANSGRPPCALLAINPLTRTHS